MPGARGGRPSPRGAELSFTCRGRPGAGEPSGRGAGRELAPAGRAPEAAEALAWRLTRPEGNPLRQALDRLGIALLPPGAPGVWRRSYAPRRGWGGTGGLAGRRDRGFAKITRAANGVDGTGRTAVFSECPAGLDRRVLTKAALHSISWPLRFFRQRACTTDDVPHPAHRPGGALARAPGRVLGPGLPAPVPRARRGRGRDRDGQRQGAGLRQPGHRAAAYYLRGRRAAHRPALRRRARHRLPGHGRAPAPRVSPIST